eukprot:6085377-Amphidinium_carterae.1
MKLQRLVAALVVVRLQHTEFTNWNLQLMVMQDDVVQNFGAGPKGLSHEHSICQQQPGAPAVAAYKFQAGSILTVLEVR